MSILTYKNLETKWSIFLTKNNDLLLDDNFIQESFFPDLPAWQLWIFCNDLAKNARMRVYKDQKLDAKIKTAQPVRYVLIMMVIISLARVSIGNWKSLTWVRDKGIIKCILIFDPEAIRPDALADRTLMIIIFCKYWVFSSL